MDFSAVQGLCRIKFLDPESNEQEVERWEEEGPDRFFFQQASTKHLVFGNYFLFQWYDGEKEQFQEVPQYFKKIRETSKLKHRPVGKKLACLDVFSGCGGLSLGLEQAGVVECKWAIEMNPEAAKAFQINHPKSTVLTGDCKDFLRKAKKGIKRTDYTCQEIPSQGDVDLLCGGPPCQGFSAMNLHRGGKNSQLKNSLVSTYLDYCDFYRPKFFILENVQEFAFLDKSIFLRMSIKRLLDMGYQCTFGSLQVISSHPITCCCRPGTTAWHRLAGESSC